MVRKPVEHDSGSKAYVNSQLCASLIVRNICPMLLSKAVIVPPPPPPCVWSVVQILRFQSLFEMPKLLPCENTQMMRSNLARKQKGNHNHDDCSWRFKMGY